MHFLFLNTQVNWGELFEYGLAATVVAAVFVIILKPLVDRTLDTNSKLSTSVGELKETIASGDRDIKADIKESEQRIVDKFTEMIEPSISNREQIKQIREVLYRLERRLEDP